MKNNYISSKNYQSRIVILFLLFCGLFSKEASAQTAVANHDTYTWVGTTSSDWATATNWTVARGTANPGTGTYPGEFVGTDVVFINKNDTPFPPILDNGLVMDIARLNISNAFGTESGSIFTINAGSILNVGNYTLTVGVTNVTQSNNIILSGGSIVNNGTLNITGRGVGNASGSPLTQFPSLGINCGNPIVLPTVPREYGYSGTGTLTINLPNANWANCGAFMVQGNSGATATPTNNANVTYKFILNNPEITFNQVQTVITPAASLNVFRAAGGNNANKLIIGGTGLTLGTVATPSIGSLISMGGGASVTVETGTTLTLNSAAGNLNNAISGFSSNANATNLTNKGTINIQGASARSGMFFSTGSTNVGSVYNLTNEGTLNVNLNAITAGNAGFSIGNGGGGTANAGSVVNLTNSGTMTLKNTATAIGTGFAIYTTSAGEAPRLIINNSSTLNLEGSTYNLGLKTTLNNSGTINSNSGIRSFAAVNNNLGGTFNFVRNAATETTRQVTFTVTTTTDTSGGVGSIYKDANNTEYCIVQQKFGSGTDLIANVLSNATIPTSGTLTRVSAQPTSPVSATIAYLTASIPALNNAINIGSTGSASNSGTINTDTASSLNTISAPVTTATSVLSPGADGGKGILGIAAFPSSASYLMALQGTLKMQASGSATAGVDYDKVEVMAILDVLDISGATLDVTGLYTPTVYTTIDIITTNTTVGSEGGIVGNFSSVIGLPAKWAVVRTPGLGNKVQLVFDPSLNTTKFAESQFSYYPNPMNSELNVSAATNISKIELFNLLGQRVQSTSVTANQVALDVSNLSKGVYVMEVTIDDAKESFKVVKQ